MSHSTFSISGMSCGHCVKAVDKALAAVAGVTKAEVAIGTATVEFDDARTSASAIGAAIDDAGYQVTGQR